MFNRDFKKGQITEDLFKKICISRNMMCIKTSKEVDIEKHIDFYITINNVVYGVDVKSRNYDEEWVYAELRNVRGENGWLFGEATYIAFERENSFILVNRQSIIDLIKSKDIKEYSKNAQSAYYKLYTRKNRNDLITKINLKDIKEEYKISIEK